MERRKFKRYPLKLNLSVTKLYKQDNELLDNIDGHFDVIDVSQTGIGFLCDKELPMDYYFNADIILNNEEHFYSVVKIIRVEREDNVYHYGCEFIGLADILSSNVEHLEKSL